MISPQKDARRLFLPSSDMKASPSYMSFTQLSLVWFPVTAVLMPSTLLFLLAGSAVLFLGCSFSFLTAAAAGAGLLVPLLLPFAAALALDAAELGAGLLEDFFLLAFTSDFHLFTSFDACSTTLGSFCCLSLDTITPILDWRKRSSVAVHLLRGWRRLRRPSAESPLSIAFVICLPVLCSVLASMVAMAECGGCEGCAKVVLPVNVRVLFATEANALTDRRW